MAFCAAFAASQNGSLPRSAQPPSPSGPWVAIRTHVLQSRVSTCAGKSQGRVGVQSSFGEQSIVEASGNLISLHTLCSGSVAFEWMQTAACWTTLLVTYASRSFRIATHGPDGDGGGSNAPFNAARKSCCSLENGVAGCTDWRVTPGSTGTVCAIPAIESLVISHATPVSFTGS